MMDDLTPQQWECKIKGNLRKETRDRGKLALHSCRKISVESTGVLPGILN